MNKISNSNNMLEMIITKLKTSSVTYEEFFKYYYLAVHESTQHLLKISEVKNSLINAVIICKSEKEFKSVNIIKNTLIDTLNRSR